MLKSLAQAITLADCLFLVGLLVVSLGVGMVYPPAGVIVAGAGLMALGYLGSKAGLGKAGG